MPSPVLAQRRRRPGVALGRKPRSHLTHNDGNDLGCLAATSGRSGGVSGHLELITGIIFRVVGSAIFGHTPTARSGALISGTTSMTMRQAPCAVLAVQGGVEASHELLFRRTPS